MKKLACVVFELEEGESVEEFMLKLESLGDNEKVNPRMVNTFDEGVTWRNKLKQILNNLGITKTSKGYSMLFYMMEEIENDPSQREHIYLKSLYAGVMEKTGATYIRIERRIRTVIDKIYTHNAREYANNVLNIPDEYNAEITTSYFISVLANLLFDN